MKQPFFDLLNEHHFEYQLHEHQCVFTVEEGAHLRDEITGAHSKNLFLKDKKKSFYLVSVLEHKRVDLKALSKKFGKGGLSFANERDLFEKLKLTPGSVTPYALFLDEQHEVTFILDKEFSRYEVVNFHPMQNDMTISMSLASFLRYFELIAHYPKIVDIPILKQE